MIKVKKFNNYNKINHKFIKIKRFNNCIINNHKIIKNMIIKIKIFKKYNN